MGNCSVARGQVPATPIFRNTAPDVGYVGSRACAGCHKELYKRFLRTAHAHSMSLAGQATHLSKVPQPVTIFDEKINRYFQVFRKGADLFQSEYELSKDGGEVFRTTHKLEYVVGSAAVGQTFLLRREGHLLEAPLSYYVGEGKWDLSPGYEISNVGFNRTVLPGCIVCHSGQPQPVAGREGLYKNPPFRELGIGCENCHGPGELHVAERMKRVRISSKADTSIVNPAKLPLQLADDICMYCHQGGGAIVLQPGKDHTDFRPGTPLCQTLAIFKLALKKEQRAESDQEERRPPARYNLVEPSWWKESTIKMSKCYQASGGRVRCLTCHNGHDTPRGAAAVAHYRRQCLTCHTSSSCRLPRLQRVQHKPPNDCVSCHMPKRAIGGIPHSASTLHRIVQRAGQPLPDIAFEQETPDLPDLVWLNGPEGESGHRLPPVTKLVAYGQLMRNRPELQKRYLALLEQLKDAAPDDPVVMGALGGEFMLKSTAVADEQAIQYLSKAIELGLTTPSTFQSLAEVLIRRGRFEEAVKVLQQGIAVAPFHSVLHKILVFCYIKLNQYPQAKEAMERYVDLFPEDSFMRGLLEKVRRGQDQHQ